MEKLNKYLIFKVGERTLAVPLKEICEIVTTKKIEPVPNAADYISGLINLRGQIIKVIDLKYMFTKKYTNYVEKRTSIVLFDHNNQKFGALTDEVVKVAVLDSSDICEVPLKYDRNDNNLISQVFKKEDSEMYFILDLSLFINNEDKIEGVA